MTRGAARVKVNYAATSCFAPPRRLADHAAPRAPPTTEGRRARSHKRARPVARELGERALEQRGAAVAPPHELDERGEVAVAERAELPLEWR